MNQNIELTRVLYVCENLSPDVETAVRDSYEIVHVPDPLAAIEALYQRQFNIIILDAAIFGKDLAQAVNEIRRRFPLIIIVVMEHQPGTVPPELLDEGVRGGDEFVQRLAAALVVALAGEQRGAVDDEGPPALWRELLMAAFAPLCHQLPARSPHLLGEPLAVCHRCYGIYWGLPLAGLLFLALRRWDRLLYGRARWVLGAALLPMTLDWGGDVLGRVAHRQHVQVGRGRAAACQGRQQVAPRAFGRDEDDLARQRVIATPTRSSARCRAPSRSA